MRFWLFFYCLLSGIPSSGFVLTEIREESAPDASVLISWLLTDERNLRDIRFAEVVRATSGRTMRPVDREDPDDLRVLAGIGRAVEAVLAEVREGDHPLHAVRRINEVSGHLEDLLLLQLNRNDDFEATLPLNAAGRVQRSGYPDIRLLDRSSGRVFYLDPKLHAAGSETSTFRTFYFEPRVETNKILDDAAHLIVGISHGGRVEGRWEMLRWNLVDLADFRVRLKAEFQGSNRDLYRPEAILAEGEAPR
jgi:hypothetical protein